MSDILSGVGVNSLILQSLLKASTNETQDNSGVSSEFSKLMELILLSQVGGGESLLGTSSSLFGTSDSSSGDSINSSLMLMLMNSQSGYSFSNLGTYPMSVQTPSLGYSAYSTYSNTQTNTSGSGIIPSQSYKPSSPAITNYSNKRSANNYYRVINQFDVENNERYEVNKNGQGDTYCNIYVWDVTKAMGAEIPHYYNSKTGEALSYPNVQGAECMTANKMQDWLTTTGKQYGWKEVSAEQAQAYANQGHPAVTTFKNSSGHGHVQVVCPSQNGGYDSEKGVTISQAGSSLHDYAYINDVFSDNAMQKVRYFVHA